MADSAPVTRGANRRPENSRELFEFSLLGRARYLSSRASTKINNNTVVPQHPYGRSGGDRTHDLTVPNGARYLCATLRM